MSLFDWLAAVLASVVGAAIIGIVGWLFGLRKLHQKIGKLNNRIEQLERDVDGLKVLGPALVEAMSDEQAGKVLKAILRERD